MTNRPATPLGLVRTRPLAQGNYGGILQAFALQRALRNIGADAVTDLAPGSAQSSLAGFKAGIRRFVTRLGVPGLVRRDWIMNEIRALQDAELARFVAEEIASVTLYNDAGEADPRILERVDFFVTGSDQVWRAAFGRVPTYLFDFLTSGDARRRIAYAASFGTAENEFTPEIVAQTRHLAQRLTAVSVREDSGVDLAREIWGIEAAHVLDPTMLLDVVEYSRLADRAADPVAEEQLVTYVLDNHPSTQRAVAEIAAGIRAKPIRLLPTEPPSYRAYVRNPSEYSRPSIEAWLGAIRDARFVVTDSFHGTVFAILYNRPFVSIVNRARGAARFESLLRMFQLEHRLIEPGHPVDMGLLTEKIDWARLNARIATERARSMSFLRDAVLSDSDQ